MSDIPWVNVAGWLYGEERPPGGGWVSDHTLRVRRHRLDTAREWLLTGGSVLFFGPPCAGKSAALDVLAASARGWRVLQCLPGWAGSHLPYAGLGALLAWVTPAELAATGPLHEDVLRRLPCPGDDRPEGEPLPGAVRWAMLDLVRRLGRADPLLLVVDEVEKLDEASADVLRFVARQVEELPVRVAAAECVTGQVRLTGRVLCPAPLLAVQLDGLVPAEPDPSYDSPDRSHRGQMVPWWRRYGAGGPQ